MIKIAICDDDNVYLTILREQIGKAIFSRTDYCIDSFFCGADVVTAIKQKCFTYDLLILDIHMDPVDGLKTAEYIRKKSIDIDIIFLTVSSEHVYDGYIYKAFAYLLKPLKPDLLKRELNRYLDEKEVTEEYLNIPVHGENVQLAIRKIQFFESEIRKVHVHLKNEEICFYGKLNELESLVSNKGFVRCHQSYLVNENYIDSIKRDGIRMGDRVIPISRKYWNELKNQK